MNVWMMYEEDRDYNVYVFYRYIGILYFTSVRNKLNVRSKYELLGLF